MLVLGRESFCVCRRVVLESALIVRGVMDRLTRTDHHSTRKKCHAVLHRHEHHLFDHAKWLHSEALSDRFTETRNAAHGREQFDVLLPENNHHQGFPRIVSLIRRRSVVDISFSEKVFRFRGNVKTRGSDFKYFLSCIDSSAMSDIIRTSSGRQRLLSRNSLRHSLHR